VNERRTVVGRGLIGHCVSPPTVERDRRARWRTSTGSGSGGQSVREAGLSSDVNCARVDEQNELLQLCVDVETVRPVDACSVSTQLQRHRLAVTIHRRYTRVVHTALHVKT